MAYFFIFPLALRRGPCGSGDADVPVAAGQDHCPLRNSIEKHSVGGGVLPRPREGQSPSPTHHKIRFRRGRCLHRPARAYTVPLVNGVIAKSARTPAVAIRSPLDLHRGITDSHDQSADWSRNDRFIARCAVDDRRRAARPAMAKFSALFLLCGGPYFFANLTNTPRGASGKIYAFV